MHTLARASSMAALRAASAALPGSMLTAKRALLAVYSCAQYTAVSRGSGSSLERLAHMVGGSPGGAEQAGGWHNGHVGGTCNVRYAAASQRHSSSFLSLSLAFKQPPAAERKERVTREQCLGLGRPKRDVPARQRAVWLRQQTQPAPGRTPNQYISTPASSDA